MLVHELIERFPDDIIDTYDDRAQDTEAEKQIDESSQNEALYSSYKNSANYQFAKKQKNLPANEQLLLISQAQAGNKQAYNQLVSTNLRLVMNIASRYKNRGMEFDDLFQEGVIGLMHSVEKFSMKKGAKFSTYATLWIRQYIQRALNNKSLPIRLPVNLHMEIAKVKNATKKFKQEFGREPNISELSKETSLSVKRVKAALESSKVVCSVDMTIGDGDTTLGSLLPSSSSTNPELVLDTILLQDRIEKIFDQLELPEALVLRLYFGLETGQEYSFRDIGEMLGISEKMVATYKRRSLKKVNKHSPSLNAFIS